MKKHIERTGVTILAVAGLFAALGAGTAVRADDPPKKPDGKVKFTVGPVTHTPDNKKPNQQPPPRKQDPGKGKQPAPKGN